MSTETKPTLILGVTGSIAAYKAADLTSHLTRKGYNVVVVMTVNAQKLIGAPTFFSLSRNPVITDLFNAPDWKPEHIELADRAQLFVVAPATANCLGKLTHGIADDALSTALMSCRCPILLAPAMNTHMWQNIAIQENVATLKQRGVHFAGPVEGDLACGERGIGRMCDVEKIIAEIETILPLKN